MAAAYCWLINGWLAADGWLVSGWRRCSPRKPRAGSWSTRRGASPWSAFPQSEPQPWQMLVAVQSCCLHDAEWLPSCVSVGGMHDFDPDAGLCTRWCGLGDLLDSHCLSCLIDLSRPDHSCLTRLCLAVPSTPATLRQRQQRACISGENRHLQSRSWASLLASRS